MRVHALVEENEEGHYSAQCVEVPAAVAEGATRAEALQRLHNAIARILDERLLEAREIVRQANGTRHGIEALDVDSEPMWMRR